MKTIIPNVWLTPGKHCVFSCLWNMMLNNAYDVSEEEIYFLSNGLNMEYKLDLNEFGVLSWDTIIKNFAISYGLDSHFSFESSTDLFTDICDALQKNNLVLLFMHNECLTYHKNKAMDSKGGHAILLYGVDTEKNKAYVGDPFLVDDSGKVRKYQGPAKLTDIKQGIWGYAWFDFKKMHAEDINVVKQAINHIETFLIGGMPHNGYYQGHLALKKYIEDFSYLKELDNAAFFKTVSKIYYDLRIDSILHMLQYLKDFIEQKMDKEKHGYQEISVKLDTLHNKWRSHAFNILKMGITCKREKVDDIIKISRELIYLQENILVEAVERMKSLS